MSRDAIIPIGFFISSKRGLRIGKETERVKREEEEEEEEEERSKRKAC